LRAEYSILLNIAQLRMILNSKLLNLKNSLLIKQMPLKNTEN